MKTQVFQRKFKFAHTKAQRHKIVFVAFLAVSFLNALSAQDNDDLLFYDEGITIIGTEQTSQQMTIIDREEIERRGSSDLVNLLHETLGFNIVRHGAYGNQASISLRGLDSKRIAFLINGIPANTTFDGKFDINQIDINSIERIEVIYGGSDTRHNISGAMGGVINIITTGRFNPGWQFNFTFSNTSAVPGEFTDTQNIAVSAMYGSDNFSLSVNTYLNNAQNHFQYEDHSGDIQHRENNEVWDFGAGFSALREFSNLTKFISFANFYYGEKNIPNYFSSSGVDQQGETAASISFLIDAPVVFRDDLASDASFTWHINRRSYTGEFDDSLHNQNSFLAANRWSWFSTDKLTLRSGVDYRYIFLDSTDMYTQSRHDGGFYFTIEYKPVDFLLIIPSTKIVYSSTGSENYNVIPKLGLLLNVTDSFAIKNNYFRSFKFPEFEELFWDDGYGMMTGNPDLRPEDGWGGDLGFEWQIYNFARLENVFFAQWLTNSIHWFETQPFIWQPQNAGEAVFFGNDFKISFEIPVMIDSIEKIAPSFFYRYLLSYMLDDDRTFSSNMRVPYSPENTFGFSLDIFWETGSLTVSGFYEGLRYHDIDNTIELEPYFLLNAGVNQQIGKYITTFIHLRNILNQSYRTFYGAPPYQEYPMPGFTVTLGMRVRI